MLDLVVEAATENIDLKLKIFKQLDDVCGENTILAQTHHLFLLHKSLQLHLETRKSDWYALYEPCTDYEISRNYSWL